MFSIGVFFFLLCAWKIIFLIAVWSWKREFGGRRNMVKIAFCFIFLVKHIDFRTCQVLEVVIAYIL